MLKFVKGEPALIIGKSLVVADLHLGLEYELDASGFKIPDQAGAMYRRVAALLGESGCDEVVVLGDIKHTIVRPLPEAQQSVFNFVEKLGRIAKVTLVQGNHDGGLKQRFPQMVASGGLDKGGAWLFHGHAAPAKTAKTMVMGHMHPVVEFHDSVGGRVSERAWLRCPLKKPAGGVLYVMPAFNPLLGGADVRRGISGPMRQKIDYKASEIYLLDGLYVGEVGDLK